MIDVEQKKNKIISYIQTTGPSLPVRIAKVIEMDPMFASAILSELLNSKKIKMSNLRVGSSALYLIPGQENRLEEHTDNLKSIEKEAYLKLKESIILEDEKEEPATRVALRNIKDFAIPFEHEGKLLWKFSFSTEEEIQKKLNPKRIEIKEEPEIKNENSKEEKTEIRKERILENKGVILEKKNQSEKQKHPEEEKKRKVEEIFENKDSDKPEFLEEIKDFLKKKNIILTEEIKTEKKEIIGKAILRTSIGEIEFLLVAKNKLTTNKEELTAALQQARHYRSACLFILKKEPQGAIKKFFEENPIIKLLVI